MLSVFEQCRDEPAEMEAGWEQLYRDHHGDLVGLAIRGGCDVEDAKDLVQELFLRLFKRGMLPMLITQPVERQKIVLRKTLKWMTSNFHRHRRSVGRGAGYTASSLDLMMENGEELASYETPVSRQDRKWVTGLLGRSLERLRVTVNERQWSLIEEALFGSPTFEEGGTRTGRVRVALYRARLRLREFVLLEAGGQESERLVKEALFEAAAAGG